jgi:DNA-binding FadR family transcriptional regulator
MDGIVQGNSGWIAPTSSKMPKLAERIATQIGDAILSETPQPGTPLGTEADLLSRYGSSRCTMREAIAILEREGVVTVRRGRGGGLFVAPPDMLSVSHAMQACFEYLDVGAAEIMAARRILNPLAVRLAVERLQDGDIGALRRPGMRFWSILKASQNPVLDILSRSARRFEILTLLRSDVTESEYFDFLGGIFTLLGHEAEAIIGGNVQLALELESENLERSEAFMTRMLDAQRALPSPELVRRLDLFVGKQRPLKKPERVTYALMADIIDLGWPAGHHLGSEQEMLERYAVGRSVFREAVRPMEQYSVVEMRTGRKSGLKISAPTPEKIATECIRAFRRLDTPRQSFTEIYDALGAAVVSKAVGHSEGQETLDPAARLRDILAGGGGNRIIAVMLQVLGLVDCTPTFDGKAGEAVVAAIDAGDTALAWRSFRFLRES